MAHLQCWVGPSAIAPVTDDGRGRCRQCTADTTGASRFGLRDDAEVHHARPMILRTPAGLSRHPLSPVRRIEELAIWTLEVVVVPVADVDRAKAFYSDKLGFAVDHDTTVSPGNRVVQLTPPGSGCSVVIGEGVVPYMPPGSVQGLQLVVPDIARAHAHLVERGVEVSEIQSVDGDANKVRQGGTALDNVGFIFFRDPDGNGWAAQQISARA
jgi:catechol 2,3-dioxygenase-like lactoylglutathione lyase family enzyme